MKLLKFSILDTKDTQLGAKEVDMLINVDHVVSIKPIRMVVKGSLVEAFWIRTTNGKKYKAMRIPQQLLEALDNKTMSHADFFGEIKMEDVALPAMH